MTRYPQLFTRTVKGIPVVTALFDPQGNLCGRHLEVSSKLASADSWVSEASFSRFGVMASDLQYVAEVSDVHLPANNVVVAFAGLGSREAGSRTGAPSFSGVFKQAITPSEGDLDFVLSRRTSVANRRGAFRGLNICESLLETALSGAFGRWT